mmetsp:Transcript_9447/g.1402  ORF Transcript_9447/g.1402 Transcript_9447/m.1402 type:complete len:100 (-) Transcript_9447:674-973(-)
MDLTSSTNFQARTVIRKQCSGDFCHFILNTSKLSSDQVDYDDLLKKVRLAYAGDGNREANKIKLSLAVDYLLKEKEKLMPINVVNKVPYKYVFMGKLLL